MMFDINELNNTYTKWNKDNIHIVDQGDFVEITTPFVDNHHDYLQVVLYYNENGQLVLSDDGYTLNELTLYEIDYKRSSKRKEFLNQTLKSFGVTILDSDLTITFDKVKDFPRKLLYLLQCILRLSDMLLTSRSTVTSIFYEEVGMFFDDNNILKIPDVGITGTSGNENKFDYIIPASRVKKEKVIKTINKPNGDNFKYPLLSFLDIKENRAKSEFVVIANDDVNEISEKFETSFTNHGISVLRWTERKTWIDTLNPTLAI